MIEGWPQPDGATMAERRSDLLGRQGPLRRAVVCEPRGHDAVAGALLTPSRRARLHRRRDLLQQRRWARGVLKPAQRWRQESLTGGLFEAWLDERGDDLVPHVRGRAFITGRATLVFDPRDPFREGFTAVR